MAESRKTQTSSFGSSKRESHDASAFYERFEPPVIIESREVSQRRDFDTVFLGDARSMGEIPDNSVALVVTSPPYFAGKEYEEDMGSGHVPASYSAYLEGLEAVFAECVRTLEPGGRIAVNVANLGRKPYRSLSGDVMRIFERLKLLLRGEVVWVKARGASGSTAWGTFQRPANPVLRDLSERVIIASKGRFDRAYPARERADKDLPHVADIWRDEFMEATTDIWEIPSESATRVNHPAPFPVELPGRLIELYTYRGDLVLDPFMGSGTTGVAAKRAGRHWVGYEIDEDYHRRAIQRIADTDPDPSLVRLGTGGRDEAGTELERAVLAGRGAKDIARLSLVEAGFADIDEKVRIGPGLDVTFEARDTLGRPWLFEVVGGFTATRAGLGRADLLWRAVGKAAAIDESRDGRPLVLLTPNLPGDRSPAARVLEAVTGPGRPVHDVVALLDPTGADRLAELAAGSRA